MIRMQNQEAETYLPPPGLAFCIRHSASTFCFRIPFTGLWSRLNRSVGAVVRQVAAATFRSSSWLRVSCSWCA